MTAGRSCGSCSLCCVVLRVDELAERELFLRLKEGLEGEKPLRELGLSPDDLLVVSAGNLLPMLFQNYVGTLDNEPTSFDPEVLKLGDEITFDQGAIMEIQSA